MKIVVMLTIAIASTFVIRAQTVEWRPYSLTVTNASVEFPKMPTRYGPPESKCSDVNVETFSVYSEGSTYTVSTIRKRTADSTCEKVIEEFAKSMKEAIVIEQQSGRNLVEQPDSKSDDRRFAGPEHLVRIVNDKSNWRWFLLETHRPSTLEIGNRFLNSLSLKAAADAAAVVAAKPIVPPAPVSFPSAVPVKPVPTATPKPLPSPVSEAGGPTKGVELRRKPRSNYTNLARFWNIEGNVALRVTFSANGEIGAISVVESLPYGLTEEAIIAARSMSFVPAVRNGVPYSVVKMVIYEFSIV